MREHRRLGETRHFPDLKSGFRISLLGVDGIGKTSLTEEMRGYLAERGLKSEIISWRRLVNGSPAARPYPQATLEQLWVEDWRLLYGGGVAGGTPVDDRMPRRFEDFQDAAVEETFPLGADGVRSSGPMVSGLVESAIDFVIEAEVIRPLVDAGVVTVRESFGFKPVLKSLLIARKCAAGSVPATVVDRMIDRVIETYSDPYLQPDIGIYLDGDVSVAYERRRRDGRGVGIAEDFGLAGQSGEESFLALQAECATYFDRVARRWGWYRLPIDHRTPAELCEQVVAEVLTPYLERAEP